MAELEEEISTRWTAVNECFLTDGAEPQQDEPGERLSWREADPGQMEATMERLKHSSRRKHPWMRNESQDEGERKVQEQQGQLRNPKRSLETETGAKPEEAPEGTFSKLKQFQRRMNI